MINFEHNDKRYISNLSWEFVTHNKLSGKAINAFIDDVKGRHPLGINLKTGNDDDRISLGFITDEIKEEVDNFKQTYSIAAVLSQDYKNCYGLFDIHGRTYFVIISNGCVVPETDIVLHDTDSLRQAREQLNDISYLFDHVPSPKFITNDAEKYSDFSSDNFEITEVDFFNYLDESTEKLHLISTLKGLTPTQFKIVAVIVLFIIVSAIIGTLLTGKEEKITAKRKGPNQAQLDARDREIISKDVQGKMSDHIKSALGNLSSKWVNDAFKKARYIPRHVAGYRYISFVCLDTLECETFWEATRTADPEMFEERLKTYDANTQVRFTLDGEQASKVVHYTTSERGYYGAEVYSLLPVSDNAIRTMIAQSRKLRRKDFNLEWDVKEPTKRTIKSKPLRGSRIDPEFHDIYHTYYNLRSSTNHSLPAAADVFNGKYETFRSLRVAINPDHSITWEVEGVMLSVDPLRKPLSIVEK